jgi:anthranilate phosphoribosyltransferase
MGVFHPDLVGIQIRVLERLGMKHALVVYGKDGLDEISLGASTLVGELKDGQIIEYEIHPEDFGIAMTSSRAFKVENAQESKNIILSVLEGQAGPALDIVALNSGAALYASDLATSIGEGIELARATITSGAAMAKMLEFVQTTQELGEKNV